MNKLSYQKQSIVDLKYKLFTSCKLGSSFNILKNKVIDWQSGSLNFSIIGSSHFVKIDIGDDKLTELIACVKSAESDKDIINKKKLVDQQNYNFEIEFNRVFKYSFASSSINEYIDNYQEFKDNYIDNNTYQYFDYIFPSPAGLAITSIQIEKKINKIFWITYHSYPEENSIIKTKSMLERRNKN